MRRAIYPGSFDPVTNGHLDIIERGCKLFDEIIIAISINPDKEPLFSTEERREIIEEVVSDINSGSCRLTVEALKDCLSNMLSSVTPMQLCVASGRSPITSMSCRWR